MGKKDKAKKGKGAEKITKKTQQKLEKKAMKGEQESGQCSIEQLIDEFQQEQKKLTQVTIVAAEPPSPRVEGSGGPCARSGHRMLFWKNSLLLFGGFNDTGRKTVYFNDLWLFDLSTKRWMQVKLSGDVPSARSGCLLFPCADMKSVFIYGGYRKEYAGRDVERGVTCTDFFRITIEKDGSASSSSCRLSGVRPNPPRSAMAGVLHTTNRALLFGGVHDVESEDGESVVGHFHNELFSVELDKARWYMFNYTTPKMPSMDVDPAATVAPSQPPTAPPATPVNNSSNLSDGVFTLTLQKDTPTSVKNGAGAVVNQSTRLVPTPRSSPGLCLLGSMLYVYGGVFEAGDRKITLDDFYCIDLSQPVTWQCLYQGTQTEQEWFGSDLEDDDDDDEEEDSEDDDKAGDGPMDIGTSESSSDDEEELVEDAPMPEPNETEAAYWTRTTTFWSDLVRRGLDPQDKDAEGSSTSDTSVASVAKRLAKDFFKQRSNP